MVHAIYGEKNCQMSSQKGGVTIQANGSGTRQTFTDGFGDAAGAFKLDIDLSGPVYVSVECVLVH